MNKNIKQDERVLNERRKIGNDACAILMLMLLMSILIQQFIFKAPIKQYAVEMICFFGISIYITIRNIQLGNDVFGETRSPKELALISSFTCSATIAVMQGVFFYMKPGRWTSIELILTVVVTFICAFLASLAVFYALYKFQMRKQKQIEAALEDESDLEVSE